MTLGPGFAGTAAGTGRRLAAFTLDVVVICGVAVAVGLPTGSWLLGAVALLQAVLGQWVLEARTGATVGKALLGLRTARDDGPYSPGAGRGFVRGFITALGFAGAAIGAWLVVASSAWDASGRRRSWADRAAQTVVVAVPSRAQRVAAMPVDAATAFRGPAPVARAHAPAAAPTAVAELGPVPAGVAILGQPPLISAPPVAWQPARRSDHAQPVAVRPVDQRAVAPAVAPGAAAASVAEPVDGLEGALLIIFDTGAREQLPLPVVANLGRNPSPTEPGDRLVTVHDPDGTVSKTHLRLEHSRGNTWVTDGGSTNGTEVLRDDGDVELLAPGVRTALDDGDRVRIGNRTFTMSLLLASDGENR
ncbi:FHA domain-containing protein [Agromyces sp. CFH 90414]|uniref:FHA domain-containing protein n=1 Tax=Agromyces agglutinans TaxID=2662258 RepID=A0A6I2F5Q9_9MICO|nr:RDD family protein [Agromyces agglutinans]MRG59929.1 FHA domain-containing protein [Agromyces agglutinans]